MLSDISLYKAIIHKLKPFKNKRKKKKKKTSRLGKLLGGGWGWKAVSIYNSSETLHVILTMF